MGSPSSEADRSSDEGSVHKVKISAGFWLGKYPVTQKQWLNVMGNWPDDSPSSSRGVGDNYPAYYVSWNDIQGFIKKLNKQSVSCSEELDSERVSQQNAGDATASAAKLHNHKMEEGRTVVYDYLTGF